MCDIQTYMDSYISMPFTYIYTYKNEMIVHIYLQQKIPLFDLILLNSYYYMYVW